MVLIAVYIVLPVMLGVFVCLRTGSSHGQISDAAAERNALIPTDGGADINMLVTGETEIDIITVQNGRNASPVEILRPFSAVRRRVHQNNLPFF